MTLSRCASCGGTLQLSTDGEGLCAVCLLGLAAHSSTSGTRSTSPEDPLGLSIVEDQPARYGTLSVLGGSAFGTTYLAEGAPPLPPFVAVKVVNLQVDAAAITQVRLLRRRLAAVRHDALATLLDVGFTPAGAPYFIREYFRGLPIDRHAARFGLDLRARLGLIERVLSAISRAHSALITHGGIKPSNVLIVGTGADWTPKVLDFGVLHALAELDATMAVPSPSADVQDLVGLVRQLVEPAGLNSTDRVIWTELDASLGRLAQPELASSVSALSLFSAAIERALERGTGPPTC